MKVNVTLDLDFRLLKQQKEQLLAILSDDNNKDAAEGCNNLDGIIGVIDSIQDQAAEILGEEIVFQTEENSMLRSLNLKPYQEKEGVI